MWNTGWLEGCGTVQCRYCMWVRMMECERDGEELHWLWNSRRGEPGTVQGNGTLDDCTLYLTMGHLWVNMIYCWSSCSWTVCNHTFALLLSWVLVLSSIRVRVVWMQRFPAVDTGIYTRTQHGTLHISTKILASLHSVGQGFDPCNANFSYNVSIFF